MINFKATFENKRNLVKILLVTLLILIFVNSKVSASSNNTVKIAHSSWIGFYPLDLAEEKGFFEDYGVKVQIKDIESKSDSKSALAAGKIQGIATSLDTNVLSSASGLKIQNVLALDTSTGADGLVGNKNIKNFKELKGKTVALDTTGGASYFWFNYMLQKNNMKLSDIKVESMDSGAAGSAFVAGKVDAAMTWQPWLSKAKATKNGHVVMSSKSSPGIIVDTLGLSTSFIKKHPTQVKGIIKGWYKALAYMKSNPKDAYKIMSKKAGITASKLKSEMTTQIKLYDKKENKKYFGTKKNKGNIYKISKVASNLWYTSKISDKKADVNQVTNPKFVNEIK
ncbi:ABC transporter substrate-binding protein [Liquorilactobacillus mali]|uniref:ABC transporter substrate-binding protein n=1 Tax=Liquorilactobacillus mali TaxID=1618 RepID=UPI0002492044|nr:ABC transporter substrate-binding protein [Liquorilactobacillus mali]EJF01037.1 aliphatic sulfonate ABC transporter substrate-binding protein [Liquorilactobacillus mali KCTC 3596 = DSM 20444]MDC7953365.1 ABC transporter substrate-binding protein [Liquorilactobacillus mali]QFQ75489.1 ABC transporter substrate-binding protein [Liquorilactobacillus mali]